MANRYSVEYTDTFGGEANYCWVKRGFVSAREMREGESFASFSKCQQKSVMRAAKALMGLTGARGVTYSYGDAYEFRPYGSCTVLFVTFEG